MMQDEWPIIFDQLTCSSENYACWDCPAGRVVGCVVLDWADDVRVMRDRIKNGLKGRDW